MTNAADLIAEADALLSEMSSASPSEVADLARSLSDLARRGDLPEVAEAADAVVHAAAQAGPKQLAVSMQRLLGALAAATLQAA